MTKIEFEPIGIIHTPFKHIEGMPIQPVGAKGERGTIEILPAYEEGLQDLEGFSRIILLYYFHRNSGPKLVVTPFMDSSLLGVFATRAPSRPNPIGLSTVRLLGIEGGMIHVEELDILDGTPLIDIKPYVPDFDSYRAEKIGWLEKAKDQVRLKRSDDRFKR